MKKSKNLKHSIRLILILSLCSLSLVSYSQSDNQGENIKKNEIGTNLISLKENFGLAFTVNKYYFSKLSGINYKRNFGKNAIRVGYDFCDRDDEVSGDLFGTSSYQENRFRVGYQRIFGNKMIKPFVATDLTYLYCKFQIESSGGIVASYYSGDFKSCGYGFAPAVGFRLDLTHSLSLTVEASLEFLWINATGTCWDHYDNKGPKSIKSTKFVTRRNPLNIFSINYAF